MTVAKMTGTPWHTEYLHIAKEDSRRDKRRCTFYTKKCCHCFKSTCYGYRCFGSSHCMQYRER